MSSVRCICWLGVSGDSQFEIKAMGWLMGQDSSQSNHSGPFSWESLIGRKAIFGWGGPWVKILVILIIMGPSIGSRDWLVSGWPMPGVAAPRIKINAINLNKYSYRQEPE